MSRSIPVRVSRRTPVLTASLKGSRLAGLKVFDEWSTIHSGIRQLLLVAKEGGFESESHGSGVAYAKAFLNGFFEASSFEVGRIHTQLVCRKKGVA